jgi:hypothetical protein
VRTQTEIVAWKVVCINASNPRHGRMFHSHKAAIAEAELADGRGQWMIEGLDVEDVACRLKSGFDFEDAP